MGGAGGCYYLGVLYSAGKGVKQDYQQAKTYYEKACDLHYDYGAGCRELGIFYAEGKGAEGKGVRQNFQTAKEYFGMACDTGEQKGCDKYRELNEKGY